MIIRKAEIKNRAGIHVRPTGLIVQAARAFPCDIRIHAKGMEADAKDHFGILSLGLSRGDEAEIRVSGGSEEEAAQAMVEIIEREFDFTR